MRGTVRLDVSQARLRALLYSAGQVFEERTADDGSWELDVELERRDFDQLHSREGLQFYLPPEQPSSTVTNF